MHRRNACVRDALNGVVTGEEFGEAEECLLAVDLGKTTTEHGEDFNL